ncbi:MAG: amidase family protein [Nostoc sp.]
MSNIADFSASQLLSLYSDRQLSPVAATKAALERINTYNSSVNAFAIVDEKTALAEAQASEVRWLNENPRGLVDGIPFTVKDLLLTKGLPTRRGSKAIISHQLQTAIQILQPTFRRCDSYH